MKPIAVGTTDVSVLVRVLDTAGLPKTTLTYASSGLALWYRREGGTKQAISPVTLATLDAAHSDGGFLHLSDGYYRVDVPDAAFAAGSSGVAIGGSFTDTVFVGYYCYLVDRVSAPSAADVADAVWEESLLGHQTEPTSGGAVAQSTFNYASDVSSRVPSGLPGGVNGTPTVDANNYIAGIQGTLNTLDDLPTVSVPSAATIADEVRTELGTELSRITTALPNAVPGNTSGLPRVSDLSTLVAIPTSTGIVSIVGYATTDFYSDIAQGEDRTGAQATIITVTGWAGFDLTGAIVMYRIVPASDYYLGITDAEFEKELTHVVSGTTISITLAITSAESALWSAVPADAKPNYRHQVWIYSASSPPAAVMLEDGWLRVREAVEEVP